MAKSLCSYKHKTVIKNNLKKYQNLVSPGRHVCKNCGRVAKKEDNLCDPKSLKLKVKKKK